MGEDRLESINKRWNWYRGSLHFVFPFIRLTVEVQGFGGLYLFWCPGHNIMIEQLLPNGGICESVWLMLGSSREFVLIDKKLALWKPHEMFCYYFLFARAPGVGGGWLGLSDEDFGVAITKEKGDENGCTVCRPVEFKNFWFVPVFRTHPTPN